MELFTLGQGQYTEEDIKNSARAFTGWSSDGLAFEFKLGNHDTGTKTFLGRTGNFDGWDVINILFEQPALGTFICGKLYKYFASEEVDPAVVESLADAFRAGNYELKPVLRQLFLAEAFYSPTIMGTQIKSPAQLVVKLAHDLSLDTVPPSAMVQATATLGRTSSTRQRKGLGRQPGLDQCQYPAAALQPARDTGNRGNAGPQPDDGGRRRKHDDAGGRGRP